MIVAYLYPLIAGSCDLFAGWLTLRGYTDKIQPRYIIAFAAGALLSATFFHILPEVNPKTDAVFLALGFVIFYVLEKVMMIHACGEEECDIHEIGPIAVFGMAIDNILDGAGIVLGYLVHPLLGLAITLAVVFHEIPQGMTSVYIMREAKWSRGKMLLALGFAGILYPIGGFLAGLVPAGFQQKMLAFIAGDFIYIGASDLLPEAHRRFNWKVVVWVLTGMGTMYLLSLFSIG